MFPLWYKMKRCCEEKQPADNRLYPPGRVIESQSATPLPKHAGRTWLRWRSRQGLQKLSGIEGTVDAAIRAYRKTWSTRQESEECWIHCWHAPSQHENSSGLRTSSPLSLPLSKEITESPWRWLPRHGLSEKKNIFNIFHKDLGVVKKLARSVPTLLSNDQK